VFNDAANVDYQRAIQAVASGITEEQQLEETENDLSGLDVPGAAAPYDIPTDQELTAEASTMILSSDAINDQLESETSFFDPNDVRLQDWSTSATKKKRKKGIVVFIVIVLLAAIIGGGAYVVTQGAGVPSQQTVIENLFADPTSEDLYSTELDATHRSRIADIVSVGSSATIAGQEIDLTTAKVYVEAITPEGGSVPYEISLVRDGLGWKISSAILYFTSQN
jgi:hypothetical protein